MLRRRVPFFVSAVSVAANHHHSALGTAIHATTTSASIHTAPDKRAVRVVDLVADDTVPFPTIYKGLQYNVDIFGKVKWTPQDLKNVQGHIWNRNCFLPTAPAASLQGTPFAVLSDIASGQALKLPDGSEGLIAQNKLRQMVKAKIVDPEGEERRFPQFLHVLKEYQRAPSVELAQRISNVAFWAQWLIRGWLFEAKIAGEQFCTPVVPAPLSQLAFAANAALGRHQIEFVYDDYTLKAAAFPTDRTFRDVDYDDPKDILKFIADIKTPVGFCDMQGPSTEHNFRHNHSLMEQQMRTAIRGSRSVLNPGAAPEEVIQGWADIATAAERSHLVFNTMMAGTPADTYPMVRLHIKGVRGACGNVYPPDGVFYEGCGTEKFKVRDHHDQATIVAPFGDATGCYVDRDFGQTGANSSMYKWFDAFIGVTRERNAYRLTPAQKENLVAVLEGRADPGDMGDNPIDSMQRAFDLLTRPPLHLQELINAAEAVENTNALAHWDDAKLADCWEHAAFERLRTAYFVASHRMVHGKYVLKMIYQTTPVGGQSRAEGTGGSTPPFLKTFFDQTFAPAMTLSDKILADGRAEVLGADRAAEIHRMRTSLEQEQKMMAMVQSKGLELEKTEKKGESGAANSQ